MKTTSSIGQIDALTKNSEKPLNNYAILQLHLLNKNTLHYGSDVEIEGDYDFENDEMFIDWEAM